MKSGYSAHLEPVNGAAVNEGGESAQAVPEGVADGTHGQHHVQLCAAALQEHVEQGERRAVRLLVAIALPVQNPHLLTDFLLLVHGEQVGNLEKNINMSTFQPKF